LQKEESEAAPEKKSLSDKKDLEEADAVSPSLKGTRFDPAMKKGEEK
jgi:hypothetical protein